MEPTTASNPAAPADDGAEPAPAVDANAFKDHGLNRALIGKKYGPTPPFTVTEAAAGAFAEATGASYAGGDDVVPPMMGVVFGASALSAPLFDNELNVDMLRLWHSEHTLRFAAPVRADDQIRSACRLLSMEARPTGEVLNLALQSVNQDDEVVLEATAGIAIKGPRRKRDRHEGQMPTDDAFDSAPVLFVDEVRVADDASRRYAAAAGESNPVYFDDEAAQTAGLPRVILPPLAAMALLHTALVRHAGGDPMAVERLCVRFARPALMGDVLTVEARGPARGPLRLRMTNQDGTAVLKRGLANLR